MTSAVGFAGKVRRMIIDQFSFLPDLIREADLVVGAIPDERSVQCGRSRRCSLSFYCLHPSIDSIGHAPLPRVSAPGAARLVEPARLAVMLLFDRNYFTRLINQYRRKLNLASLTHAWPHILGDRLIVATDPPLGLVPADAPMQVVQTGYMHLKQPEVNLAALDEFLAAGPPPVYAGFGSMPLYGSGTAFSRADRRRPNGQPPAGPGQILE